MFMTPDLYRRFQGLYSFMQVVCDVLMVLIFDGCLLRIKVSQNPFSTFSSSRNLLLFDGVTKEHDPLNIFMTYNYFEQNG